MKTPFLAVPIGLALAVSSSLVMAGDRDTRSEPFAFAIVGDGPYGEDREPAYNRLIRDVNQDREVRFVIHAGDIKSGGERCDDTLLIRRFEQFQKFRRAFIYTPGDNEWTDCHRTSNGSYLPTERLDFIRELFFPNPGWTTGKNPFPVKTQARQPGYEKFVENTLFWRRGIIFSQIHVVGSNNNLRPWDQIDPNDSFDSPRADRLAEFLERNEASLKWLKHTFEAAKHAKAPGVFITIHANLRFDTNRSQDDRAGFNDFIDLLLNLTEAFGRPVVLAHGDFHVFLIDKPRLVPWYANADASGPDGNRQVGNLTRVQTFGDSDNHWIKVEVDPGDKEVFRFVPQIVETNL